MSSLFDAVVLALVGGGLFLLFLRRTAWSVLGELLVTVGVFLALFPKGLYLAVGVAMLHMLLFVQWGHTVSISGIKLEKISTKQYLTAVLFGLGCVLLAAGNRTGLLEGEISDSSPAMTPMDVQGVYLSGGLPYLAVVLLLSLLALVFLLVERRKR